MISGIRGIYITLLALLTFTYCYSQEESPEKEVTESDVYELARRLVEAEKQIRETYAHIHSQAVEKFNAGSQLLNGIYYEYPYTGAEGHPFLGEGEFQKGSVQFHSRLHENLMIRYDVFHGQVLARPDPEDPMLVIQLANLFVSEFWMGDMHFRKLAGRGGKNSFYQVVWEGEQVKCYYGWYKLSYKSYDEGDRITYKFSEAKKRDYLLIGQQLSVFRNNRTFIRLFPAENRRKLKDFLRSEHIRVEKADQEAMVRVVRFGESLLLETKDWGGYDNR